jgi:CBS domain-containing protein
MKLRDLMTTDLVVIEENCTLREAASKMEEVGTGVLPVVRENSDNNQPIGMVTDRDIVIRAIAKGQDPNTATVNDVITRETIFCYEQDDVRDAFEKMRDNGINRLLIMDEQKKLCGIVSMADIVSHLPEDMWDQMPEVAGNENQEKRQQRQSA